MFERGIEVVPSSCEPKRALGLWSSTISELRMSRSLAILERGREGGWREREC